jgi:hypothetical protein
LKTAFLLYKTPIFSVINAFNLVNTYKLVSRYRHKNNKFNEKRKRLDQLVKKIGKFPKGAFCLLGILSFSQRASRWSWTIRKAEAARSAREENRKIS